MLRYAGGWCENRAPRCRLNTERDVVKVGIYNQWLHTMGGGERHMGKAAEVLASLGHSVEFITHRPVSRDALVQKLHLNLEGVAIRVVPLLPWNQLAEYSAEYDLFINGSFLSVVPSRARWSVLFILFPFPLDTSPQGQFKRWLAGHLRRELLVPKYTEGFFGPEELGGSRFRWTAGQGEVILPALRRGRSCPIRLVVGSFRPSGTPPVPVQICAQRGSEWQQIAGFDVATTPGNYVTLDCTAPDWATASGQLRLRIDSPTFRPQEALDDPDDFRDSGVAVARVMVPHLRHWLYELVFERLVPELGARLHGLPDLRAMTYIQTYDLLLPISEFSQHWLQRYWGLPGQILYPPVYVEDVVDRPKQPIILGVGRFFDRSHNKRHDILIRAFRQLTRGGLKGWELHLVGSIEPGRQHARYFERLQRLAQDWPIRFHVDPPFAELRKLYEEASLYWHATGYGEREDRNPIRFEHFGITPVEAMAAGCIPGVLAKGALTETVEDGNSGFLWRSIGELVERSREVIDDPALAQRLRAGAKARATVFSDDTFRFRLTALLSELTDGAVGSASQ